MGISTSQIIIWLVFGLRAVTFAGAILKGSWERFRRFTNRGVGLVDAPIDGVPFAVLPYVLRLGGITVSLGVLVATVKGAFTLLFGLRLLRTLRGHSKNDIKLPNITT